MTKLAWDSSFRRALKRATRNNPGLQERIFEVVSLLAIDAFSPSLKTHKLRGQLEGLWACSVDYDCRIVFAFEPEPETGEEIIILIDIGTHNEVY